MVVASTFKTKQLAFNCSCGKQIVCIFNRFSLTLLLRRSTFPRSGYTPQLWTSSVPLTLISTWLETLADTHRPERLRVCFIPPGGGILARSLENRVTVPLCAPSLEVEVRTAVFLLHCRGLRRLLLTTSERFPRQPGCLHMESNQLPQMRGFVSTVTITREEGGGGERR